MVRLTALTSICGDYKGGSSTGVRRGLIHQGESFEASDSDAESLEMRGLAERQRVAPRFPAHDPGSFKMTYPSENKMLEVTANKRTRR